MGKVDMRKKQRYTAFVRDLNLDNIGQKHQYKERLILVTLDSYKINLNYVTATGLEPTTT